MREELPLCGCGCGERVMRKENKFIHGHNRKKPEPEPILCKCGCGELTNPGRRYIKGHQTRGRKLPPRTPEHCAAISKAHMGVPFSPEHCAAISDGHKGHIMLDTTKLILSKIMIKNRKECPEIWDAANENMKGGNDIVNHHFIYDHDNPDQHIVEITRSQHMSHHNWMRRNGLEVLHLNIIEENKDIFPGRKL